MLTSDTRAAMSLRADCRCTFHHGIHMIRKLSIGMLAAFIGIGVASAGYQFGKHLKTTLARSSPEECADTPRAA